MLTYSGSVEDVLRSGEYDQGDLVLVDYDELYDLVEQAKIVVREAAFCDRCTLAEGSEGRTFVERRSNRPLHPCLGGKSPYSEFLPI